MIKFLKQKNKNKKIQKILSLSIGFTLIETLVAISIFSMSILAVMSILAQSINNTNYAKNKVVASYLAQEGVEYIRNMRDTFMLYDSGGAQTGWTNFIGNLTDASACQGANGCYINADSLDYNNQSQPMKSISLLACSSSSCSNGILFYNSTTGRYGFSGVSSDYIRKIQISLINANEIRVSSIVSWTQNSGIYNIVFSENLFNWIE